MRRTRLDSISRTALLIFTCTVDSMQKDWLKLVEATFVEKDSLTLMMSDGVCRSALDSPHNMMLPGRRPGMPGRIRREV
jgi:hypothetical protein